MQIQFSYIESFYDFIDINRRLRAEGSVPLDISDILSFVNLQASK